MEHTDANTVTVIIPASRAGNTHGTASPAKMASSNTETRMMMLPTT